MSLFERVLGWLLDPAHWTGPTGIPVRVVEHLHYSALAVLLGVLLAVPLGMLVGHAGRGGVVVGSVNGLRSLPELGLLILLVLLMGFGLLPVVLALTVLAVPPLLAGTYAGIRNVDRAIVDAARGMGMREHQVLLRVELPMALPLMVGGLRAATLQVVATAAIAAVVGFGGLGRFLIDGQRAGTTGYPEMAGGAVLIAVLALATEAVLAVVQRLAVSPGLRGAPRRRRPRPAPADTASGLDPVPGSASVLDTAGVRVR